MYDSHFRYDKMFVWRMHTVMYWGICYCIFASVCLAHTLSVCRHILYNVQTMSHISWIHRCCCTTERFVINTLRPRKNGRHFPDDIFKYIFLDEKVSIFIKISLKFVPKYSINNIPALVQIMAWHRPGDKPLSEPMMVSFPTHISLGLNELKS